MTATGEKVEVSELTTPMNLLQESVAKKGIDMNVTLTISQGL